MKNKTNFYSHVQHALRASNSSTLTITYLSLLYFWTTFAFLIPLLLIVATVFTLKISQTIAIPLFILPFIIASIVFAIGYAIPAMSLSNRKRKIKDDLPFAIMHMAAVSSSGAKPLSMFKLLLKSHEYPGIEPEIRKVVNLVNLSGYDLLSSIKVVASSTPSRGFKDILNGIASTVESGGSLKSYLSGMAQDTLTTYKLDRQKFAETIATYSDIYTAVLIAAPLLFIVAVALINILGGSVGGLDAKTLAGIGTFAVLPLLNVGFYLFINIVSPGA